MKTNTRVLLWAAKFALVPVVNGSARERRPQIWKEAPSSAHGISGHKIEELCNDGGNCSTSDGRTKIPDPGRGDITTWAHRVSLLPFFWRKGL